MISTVNSLLIYPFTIKLSSLDRQQLYGNAGIQLSVARCIQIFTQPVNLLDTIVAKDNMSEINLIEL